MFCLPIFLQFLRYLAWAILEELRKEVHMGNTISFDRLVSMDKHALSMSNGLTAP